MIVADFTVAILFLFLAMIACTSSFEIGLQTILLWRPITFLLFAVSHFAFFVDEKVRLMPYPVATGLIFNEGITTSFFNGVC